MEVEVFAGPESAAKTAARFIAAAAREAVAKRGRSAVAFSGGHALWLMLRALANEDVPWDKVHIFQTGECVAPAGDPDRNLTRLRKSLLDRAVVSPVHIHAMPVEKRDLGGAAAQYARTLARVAGSPPVLDLVHLSPGPGGHSPSLASPDPILEVSSADVAVTAPCQGRRRMSLTYAVLNRARRVLWLAAGFKKAGTLARLHAGTPIAAGQLRQDTALILAGREAAEQVRAD